MLPFFSLKYRYKSPANLKNWIVCRHPIRYIFILKRASISFLSARNLDSALASVIPISIGSVIPSRQVVDVHITHFHYLAPLSFSYTHSNAHDRTNNTIPFPATPFHFVKQDIPKTFHVPHRWSPLLRIPPSACQYRDIVTVMHLFSAYPPDILYPDFSVVLPAIANDTTLSLTAAGVGIPTGNAISSVTISTCMWHPIPTVISLYSLFWNGLPGKVRQNRTYLHCG